MSRNRSASDDYLFHKGDWSATQDKWNRELVATIESINGDELLNTSVIDLARFYAVEQSFDVPCLHVDELVVDQREIQIDISQHRDRYISDRSQPYFIAGTCVDVELPFSGNKIGFEIQPSTFTLNKPRACIDNGILKFSISGPNLNSEQVKQEIDKTITSINQYLSWLVNDARAYNEGLESLATQTIERRREKLLQDKSLIVGLGFKMKERPNAAKTFAAPTVQRTIRPVHTRPTASTLPFKLEPVLTDSDYLHILSVLENMVRVMEQSPGAFREIDEESLRTHFLMQLNGHYSGDATGETFNYEGKTDILVKVDGRNIFIGECKFWTGEKGLLETLDQILSYISWRDTKAAVLVFSRNKEFSKVLDKILEFTPKHPNFKKLIKQQSETSWTYLFGHKDDSNREIFITIQAYNVPERIEPRITRI